MIDAILDQQSEFVSFGLSHVVVLGLTIGCAVFLPTIGRRLPEATQHTIGRSMALAICAAHVAGSLLRLHQGIYNPVIDLPINICQIFSLLLPFLVWRPNIRVHTLLYFLVLSGTLQAVLTPDIEPDFPHYIFIRYWMIHGGLVVVVIYYTTVFGLLPSWKGLWQTFGWLQVYIAVVLIINLTFGTNYLYLMAKPPAPTLLDALGPWPWYLLGGEALALLHFLLAYLPIALVRRQSTDGAPSYAWIRRR